ncbi:MAG TPA: RNA 2',3'-cyclic phosphodiesterase [Gammaproteobacteria bacterium]|nr:RNA 2',3'-cyclic phosphodiesterase [Gammaproteobacteria bacterium]
MKLRLFFALWPAEPVRDALAAAAAPLLQACRGRRVTKRNYHLTLAFLGGVPAGRLEAVRAAAATVQTEGFALSIDCHGHWPGPRVAWLGCRQLPAAADRLARALWAALEPLGFRPDPRPFRPHLTVLRGCRACDWAGPVAPVAWPVDDFVLVNSGSDTSFPGPHYEVLDRWPLKKGTFPNSAQ